MKYEKFITESLLKEITDMKKVAMRMTKNQRLRRAAKMVRTKKINKQI